MAKAQQKVMEMERCESKIVMKKKGAILENYTFEKRY